MGESSFTPPSGRPGDFPPLGWMPGSWFLVMLAVPMVISCWETFRVDLGLAAQTGLMERMSLIAEPFLMGAFLGSGAMQVLCNRGRWWPCAQRIMCGRFASILPAEFMARLFATSNPLPNIAPNWNTAPTQAATVIRRHPESGERHLDLLRWGLVPHFTKDLKACKRPINARSETIATSGLFRGALASRRCLVPADAFYEWKAVPDGKQPYAIARHDGTPLAFAGVWESWRDPAGELLRTFAIATTAANDDMAVLHERMPVILEEEAWPLWLGEETGAFTELLASAAPGVVRLWPVSRAVNSVRNNGAALLVEIADPGPQTPAEAAVDLNPAQMSFASSVGRNVGRI